MSSAEVNQSFYASWRHPLQNAQICLEAVPLRGLTVRALRFADKATPSEVGGLLWGNVVSGPERKTILVQQAEFIGADDNLFNTTNSALERLSAALWRPRSNLQPLGYFRSAVRGDLFPREQDRVFIESKLAGPDSFVLIIEPLLTGTCTAHFYFVQDGRLQTKSSPLRVPLGPQNSGEQPMKGAGQNAVIPVRHAEPMPLDDYHLGVHDDEFAAPANWSKGKAFFIATLLIAMAGASVYRIMSQRAQSPAMPTQPGDTPIGLQVERRPDGQLDLNWNRNFVRSAKSEGAQLSITDGGYFRTLSLTEEQLLSGKLAYFPRSDDIRFRLEISVGGNRTIGESIRVVSPEVYASTLTDSGPRSMRARTEAVGSLATGRNKAAETAEVSAPALLNGVSIVKTDTPGTYIFASRPSVPVPANSENTHASLGAQQQRAANFIQLVAEPVITALPPPIKTNSVKATTPATLAAVIATPKNPLPAPPPASAPIQPQASEPEPDAGEPALSSKALPVAEPPTPVYQVMPNTKLFGYSLVNNDVQVDIEVHIDENGVVRKAIPAAGSGRGTMLTTQALIAAKKWRFKPAEVNGRRVPGRYIISFKFRRAP